MAFLDEISRKITNAGQSAVQKTQDMASVAKINAQIADEEKKINNNYFQIGKLYVAMHAADGEEGFAGFVGAVKASEMKIAELKQQIMDIKGIVRCEKCGAEVPSGVSFCSVCGNPMPRPNIGVNGAELVRCSGCGNMMDKNMRFCTVCGKPMMDLTKVPIPNADPVITQDPAAAPVPVINPAPAAAPAFEPASPDAAESNPLPEAPVVQQVRRCPVCSAEVEEGNAFCTACGAKVV